VSQRPVTVPPARWLDVCLPTVAENLALDEALLAEVHDAPGAEAIVRTWMPAAPTVVLGSSSQISQEVDLDACRSRGVELVRRPSGGLTVTVGPGCLMWSVIMPCADASPAIDAVHAAVLEPLAAALGSTGRTVVRRGSSDLAIDQGGELRKVSGNALRIRRHAILYHGTLLDAFDLGLISAVQRHPPREPDYRAGRAHSTFLANLEVGRGPLEAAVRRAFQAEEVRVEWPRSRVAALLHDRYRDAAWTKRLA
jgi:lipoate-protein ligase A